MVRLIWKIQFGMAVLNHNVKYGGSTKIRF